MTVDLEGMIQNVSDARYLQQRQERAELVFVPLVAEVRRLREKLAQVMQEASAEFDSSAATMTEALATLEKLDTELKLRKELELLVREEHGGLVGLAWVHGWRPDPELVKKADALRAALGETM